jgi:hypothetical protein
MTKTTIFSVWMTIVTLGSSAAQPIELRSIIQIDCSAYHRQADGAWIVLRQNKIMRGDNVAREVIPGDDPEVARLTNGTTLRTNLNALCATPKQ